MGRGARKIGVSKAAGAEAERWPESGPEGRPLRIMSMKPP
mgnify:CR=1 FL=1